MESLHYLLRLLAASQVCFLCLYLLWSQRSFIGLITALTVFSLGCYLLAPYAHNNWISTLPFGFYFIGLVSNSIPALVWILGRWFFADSDTVPLLFWLIWLGYLGLWLAVWLPTPLIDPTGWDQAVFIITPQIVKLALILHVIYMVAAGGQTDLVNQRLRLRKPIVMASGALIAAVILIEIVFSGRIPMLVEAISSGFLFGLSLLVNLYLFTLRDDLPLIYGPATSVNGAHGSEVLQSETPGPEIVKIQQMMEQQRFYARHGTTIGDLADELHMPAYKLRSVINQTLGFRNFNQFLNYYRIQEASARLPKEQQLPILTIALDVGFKSLSSFNKAFKDTHQQTPSEYRSNY